MKKMDKFKKHYRIETRVVAEGAARPATAAIAACGACGVRAAQCRVGQV